MKIVNESYYDAAVFKEFNELHNSHTKSATMLFESYRKFIKVMCVICFPICYFGIRLSLWGMIIALVSKDMVYLGDSIVLCGVEIFVAVFLTLLVLVDRELMDCKFYKVKSSVYEFDEEGFTDKTTIKKALKPKRYSYNKIKKVVVGKNLILMYNSPATAFILKKDSFTVGDSDMLLELLKTKIPMLKIITV